MRSLRWKSQRGATAVEFALVVPWFLFMIAIMITLGRGFWSEFLMLNIASATTRTCALTQKATAGTDSSAELISCAQTTGSSLLGHYQHLCPGGNVQTDSPTTFAVAAANVANSPSRVHFLQYTLRCDMPLLFFVPKGYAPKIPLYARSTAPFLN